MVKNNSRAQCFITFNNDTLSQCDQKTYLQQLQWFPVILYLVKMSGYILFYIIFSFHGYIY